MTFGLFITVLASSLIGVYSRPQIGASTSFENFIDDIKISLKSGGNLAAMADGMAQQGNYAEAIWYYTKAIDKASEYTAGEYYAKRGNCYLEIGEYNKAFADFKDATRCGLRRGSTVMSDAQLSKLGDFMYRNRQITSALWCYNEAIYRNPYVAAYFRARADCHMAIKPGSEEAMLDFKFMLELDPDNEDNRQYFIQTLLIDLMRLENHVEGTLYLLTETELIKLGDEFLYSKKKEHAAIKYYNAAIEKKSENTACYEKRAQCHLKLNNTEMALSDLKTQIQIEPDNMNDWFFLIRILFRCGRIVEVEEEITKLSEARIVELGKAFLAVQRFEDAVHIFTAAIKRSPEAPYFRLRAICYLKMQNLYMAQRDFKNMIEKDPSAQADPLNRIMLNNEISEVDFEETIFSSEIDYASLAHKFIFQHDFDDALRCYTVAIERNPGDALCYGKRGICQRKLKYFDAAIEDFEKSLQLDPSNMHFHVELSDTLIELGRLDEAKRVVQRVDMKELGHEEFEKYITHIIKTTDLKLSNEEKYKNMEENTDTSAHFLEHPSSSSP